MIVQVILEGLGLGILLILVCAIGIRKGAWLSCGLLAVVRYSVGDESDRPISDRRLLGRPHKGVDDPRHRGLKALYYR